MSPFGTTARMLTVVHDPDLVELATVGHSDLHVMTLALPMQRVPGRITSLQTSALMLARTLRIRDQPTLLVGVGYAAAAAALYSATQPAAVAGLGLLPHRRHTPCTSDHMTVWHQYLDALFLDETYGSVTSLVGSTVAPFPDPLHPNDRDEMWSSITCPVVWSGRESSTWTLGAPGIDIGSAAERLPTACQRVFDQLFGDSRAVGTVQPRESRKRSTRSMNS